MASLTITCNETDPAPYPRERLPLGALATRVDGQLVTGQGDAGGGTPVAVRAVVRATGVTGAAAGTVVVTESRGDGSFRVTLAPGRWRVAATPDAGEGHVANADRPSVEVNVGPDGVASPAAVTIDLRAAARVVRGTVTTEIEGVHWPLTGVRLRLDQVGPTGAGITVEAESGADGTFVAHLPAGAATLSAMAANAAFATAGNGHQPGDVAWVVDPVPGGVPDGDAPLAIRLVAVRAIASGTVTGSATGAANAPGASGATVTATSAATGLARVATADGGARAGNWSMRLSAGTWSIIATADLPLPNGSRVPATSLPVTIEVASSDVVGVALPLITGTVALPPPVAGPADPATGGLVRAGVGSAELRIAPGAVAEPVTVTVEPVGGAPSLPGHVPFGDAFRISGVTATGVPVVNLAADSSLLVTYSRTALDARAAPVTATHGKATAQSSDLRVARFDTITASYLALLGAVASEVDAVTGLFTVSTTTLGTYVLTSRDLLTPYVPPAPPVPPVPPAPPVPPVAPASGAAPGDGAGTAPLPTPLRPLAPLPVAIPTPVPTPLLVPPTALTVALAPYQVPAAFLAEGTAGDVPDVLVPVEGDRRPDGRRAARVAVPAGGVPVVVPVAANSVATIDLPPGESVIAIGVPSLAGIVGAVIIVRIPATLSARLQAISPGATARLVVDPAPSLVSDAQHGFLGGGLVVPVSAPLDVRLDARDASGAAIRLSALRDATSTGDEVPVIDVAVPVPSRFIGTDEAFAYLVGVHAGDDGGAFLGYARVPAPFDPASAMHLLAIDADGLAGTLLLPAALRVAYVANFVPDAHLYSNPTAAAIDLGPIGGPFTPMQVVGPQVLGRILVVNPRTWGVGWVDATAVGPAGPALARLRLRPATDPVDTAGLPRVVRTRSATAHAFGHEGPTAIDFGPVGPAGTTLEVIGPVIEGRAFVFIVSTHDYAWVDVSDLDYPGAPPPAPSPAAPRAEAVQTMRDWVRLFSGPAPPSVDFGPVGPAGSPLVIVGPRDGDRALAYNPATDNYGWVDLSDVGPPGSVPAPRPATVQTTRDGVHAFAHEGPTAIDFGPVGPAGTPMTVVGPTLEGRALMFIAVTGNYAWVDVADTRPVPPR